MSNQKEIVPWHLLHYMNELLFGSSHQTWFKFRCSQFWGIANDGTGLQSCRTGSVFVLLASVEHNTMVCCVLSTRIIVLFCAASDSNLGSLTGNPGFWCLPLLMMQMVKLSAMSWFLYTEETSQYTECRDYMAHAVCLNDHHWMIRRVEITFGSDGH